MLDEVLGRLPPGVAGSISLVEPRWSLYNNQGPVSSSVLAFLFVAGDRVPRLVVKLSRQTDTIRREEAALRRLSALLPDRVPRPYLSGELRGMAFLIMEAIDTEYTSVSRFEDQFPAIFSVILALHGAVGSERPADDRASHGELVQTISQFEARCGASEPGLSAFCSRLRDRIHSLAGLGLPSVPQHGDFSLGNVLSRRSGGIVVIDWEDYASVTLPGYDLVVLFASLPGRDFLGDRGLRLLLSDGLQRYATQMKVDERWLPILVPLHLARFFLFCEATGRTDPARAALSHLGSLARDGGAAGPLMG
jgi:aminoglycoside phosphotransferase (APT) family kinase protein